MKLKLCLAAAVAGAVLLSGGSVRAQEAKAPMVVVVVVEGEGETIDEAKESALREAVESVVGSLLKSVTTSENGEIVKDKIQSCSSAYVEKSTMVGDAVKDEDSGLFTVKVKASVRKSQLAGDIEKYAYEIKGSELSDKIEQVKNNQKKFEEFFREEFGNAIEACVVADPLAEEGCLPFTVNEEGEVSMKIRVGVDMENYGIFARSIVEKLKPFAKSVERIDGAKDSTYNWDVKGKNTLLVVDNYKTLAATVLTFSEVQIRALCNVLAGVNKSDEELAVVLRMLDGKGRDVFVKKIQVRDKADSFRWRRIMFQSDKPKGICAILPSINFGACSGYSYTRAKTKPLELEAKLGKIDSEDLDGVDTISIRLNPPKQNFGGK